ncbi:hypothetical protein HYE82_03015 [Streptomyces sp. BR123]|nr:hypothetical protein [Streptomyces sp. BR123]
MAGGDLRTREIDVRQGWKAEERADEGGGVLAPAGAPDRVATRPVVARGASAATLRVRDGEREHPAGREALGKGREQELGGDEADGSEQIASNCSSEACSRPGRGR